jgi:thiamine biosynthesis protein ThiC
MDVTMVAAASGIGTVACGVFLYVVRAEHAKARTGQDAEIARVAARIARHEAECTERNKNADERHELVTASLGEIKADVKDILRHMSGR